MAGNHILFLISGATGLQVSHADTPHADMPRPEKASQEKRGLVGRMVGMITGRAATNG